MFSFIVQNVERCGVRKDYFLRLVIAISVLLLQNIFLRFVSQKHYDRQHEGN